MCLGTTTCWLSGANPWRGGNMHGPGQSSRNRKLANTNNSQTSPIIFGLLQFLLTVYLPIFSHHKTPEWTNQKGYPMDMDRKTTRCLWYAQKEDHNRASAKTTTTRPTVWSRSRCFGIHDRGCTNAKRWERQKTSHCLFLKYPKRSRTELWHLHPRTLCDCMSAQALETILGRIPSWSHRSYWPCKPQILERTPEDQ